MRTCRDIVKLASSADQLSLTGRMEIFMHRLICTPCRLYLKQLQILKKAMQVLFGSITEVPPEQIQKLEKEIIDKISKVS